MIEAVTRTTLLLATLVALLGCDPGTDPEAGCGTGPGTIEVGRVDGARLVALPRDGGELPIVRGPQGGIHVLTGVWVDAEQLELSLDYRLTDPTDGTVVGEPTTLDLTPSLFDRSGARPARFPDLVILDGSSAPVELFAGLPVVLEAQARWPDGSLSCDARSVTLTGE